VRKFLFAVILCFLPVVGFGAKFYTNSAEECWVRSGTGITTTNWYCGSQTHSCAGHEAGKKENVHDLRNHEVFSTTGTCGGKNNTCDSLYYMCCGGTDSRSGKFKAISKSQYDNRSKENDESVTLQVNGGTCTYTKKTHAICGDVTDDPKCTEATDCSAGFILRHGKCLPDCTDGKGFDGQDSDTCVDCARTTSQGTMYNSAKTKDKDIGTICIKCHPDTQLFKEGRGCISLDEAEAKYTNHEFQQCWKCANNNTRLEDCIKASHISMGTADQYVKTNCQLEAPDSNPGGS